jgi:curved DNA-binding protein CbpA
MKVTREEAFAVLELEPTEDAGAIRAAYRRLALRWHPDKNDGSEEATARFQQVSAAYARLTAAGGSDDELSDVSRAAFCVGVSFFLVCV